MTRPADVEGRRPLKVRDARLAARVAAGLSARGVTPNQISLFSVVFAALGALCLALFGQLDRGSGWWLPLLTAAFIQLRLLCNLFDGMVAVEGGMGTPSGELFNDVPDRVADPLLLVAAGYAVCSVTWGADVGWLAGLLAVMTAYMRTLAASIGAPVDFRGPMAKQHRMALLTVACVAVSIEAWLYGSDYALLVVVCIIAAGSALTVARRALAAWRHLESAAAVESTADV